MDQWDETLRGPKMSNTVGRTIYKYQMPVLEEFTMELPKGAEILRVDDQDGMFWLWAMVNTEAEDETRHFMAFKTGGTVPDNVELRYLGFCKIFVQAELGLYLHEVVQDNRSKEIPAKEEIPGMFSPEFVDYINSMGLVPEQVIAIHRGYIVFFMTAGQIFTLSPDKFLDGPFIGSDGAIDWIDRDLDDK